MFFQTLGSWVLDYSKPADSLEIILFSYDY